MNTTLHRLGLVAGGLALLTVGWWLGRQPADPPAAATPSALQRSGAADATTAGVADLAPSLADVAAPPQTTTETAATAPGATGSEALPPADTPVVELFAALQERARRGDASAACRLASELQRCQRARFMAPHQVRMEESAAQVNNPARREAMIQHLARMQAEDDRAKAVCADLEDSHFAAAFPLQMQAAQSRPELRVWAATNPALDAQNFLNELESWAEYRRVALPWLQAAAADGDIAALIVLARIHGDRRPGVMMTPPLRQPDDAAFVRYVGMLERHGVSIPVVMQAGTQARERLDAATLARIDSEIAAQASRQPSGIVGAEELRQAMQRSFADSPGSIDCG